MEEKHYKLFDLLRAISCLAVLLFHIGLLKGGYLAVCTFFVMSGYLNVVSSFKKEKFSIKDYYVKRFKKIYLPLLLIVFISNVAVLYLSNLNWINFKPEVSSIIFGYNNFWQLNANLDYFVRNISSPFTHLWYISIFLQYELIFPFLFLLLKKVGEKVSKFIPCFFLFVLSIASSLFFYFNISSGNIMQAYYGSFERLFSFSFGMFLAFIHMYWHPLVYKNKVINTSAFLFYIVIFCAMFFFIDSGSSLFTISMFLVTLISMRLLDISTYFTKGIKFLNILSSFVSNISYEIYLIQYPVIFLFQELNISSYLKIVFIVFITFVLSFIIHFALNIKKKSKFKIFRILLTFLLSLIGLFGFYKFIIAKDYTNDMKKLKENLANNQKLIEERQKEFLNNQEQEEKKWEEFLNNAEKDESEIADIVRNLKVVGIGDSIMELAVKSLYKEFPNGYFDAATNRTDHSVAGILKDLKKKGIEADIYVFNLGTNGECSSKCKEEIMELIGDKKLFWLNATKPDFASFNTNLIEFAKTHNNVFIIDWISVAKAHPEYLIYDGIHPNRKGCDVYAKTIYDSIYNHYLDEFIKVKNEKIKEHEEYENNKITFIGNDLLMGIYDNLMNHYSNKKFVVNSDFNYESLISYIENTDISNNIVLVFDNSVEISNNQYKKVFELLKGKNVYVVSNNKFEVDDSIKIINFDFNKYLDIDRVHLTDKGNNILYDLIISNVLND